jgi:hypothetical protein
MWLPTPIYERIPQFWFLLGLLFFSAGLYLGFEFELSFWYLAVGFCCCSYGVGIFLIRLRHRQGPQTVAPAAAQRETSAVGSEAMESESAESPQAEAAHAD